MKLKKSKRVAIVFLSAFFYITTSTFFVLPIQAAPASESDYQTQAEERKELPIQSNEIENWPDGPAISAESAILMEANTGVILYAKNIDEKSYPASTTKLMTCLITVENSELNEIVEFSHDAVFSIESGSSNIGIDPGQSMPIEECLYGILVASANEVANAVAEHVAGSTEAFADLMNQKAEELGCKNTHFVNAHGLYHENHYTTAYDLALIARACFQNELISKIANTSSYHFVATANQPDDFIQRNKHKLITGEIAYEGIKGGKTGYTDEARQTLVTCAEKNGMKLICVVMKEETPDQFHDTVKLFDYGFSNFSVVNVAENETRYNIKTSDFFHTSYDVFGNSEPILSLNQDSYLILPKTVDFEDLTSEITYDVINENEVARINYTYHDAYVGTATINFAEEEVNSYSFNQTSITQDQNGQDENEKHIIYINIKIVILVILLIAALAIIVSIIHDVLINYTFLDNRRNKRHRNRTRKFYKKNRDKDLRFPSSRFRDYDL